MMERQLTHITRLVDDLLDVNRVSLGRMELRSERFALASAVEQAIEFSRPSIDGKSQALTVSLPDGPTLVSGDPIRLAQVVGNLLNNASKFSGNGAPIELVLRRAGREAVLSVRDCGIGIAPDQLGRVFEMFAQVDASRDHSQGGLGIGLALVKGLIEMHRGTVTARSDGVGRGSEFVVRLPCAG